MCALSIAAPARALCSQAESESGEEEKIRLYFGRPFIVTASRLGEPLDRALKSVTVITAEDIARRQAVTVAEALRAVPGVSVQSSGGTYGSVVDVRLRGADTDQVLVMIDGVQVNSTWLGAFSFADMPAENVERIEVVRGPASALYGSEAVGGVINIISRRGEGGFAPTLTLQGGSLGTARALASMGGTASIADYSLTVSRLSSDGTGSRDGYDNTSFAGRLGVHASRDKTIALSGRYSDGRKEVPHDFQFACDELWHCTNDPNNGVENRFTDLSVRYSHEVSRRWDYSVVAGVVDGTLENENDADPDPTFEPPGADTVIAYSPTIQRTTLDTRRYLAETQHNLRVARWGVLSLGVEAELEEAERTDFSNFSSVEPELSRVDVDRTNIAYFAQQRIELGPPGPVPDWKEAKEGMLMRLARRTGLSASASLGLRVDDNSQFGSEASPKAAFGLDLGWTGTAVALIWSESYNAPSLTDLYFPDFSNPDLGPETSSTTEFIFRQKLLGHRAGDRLARALSEMAEDAKLEGEGPRLDALPGLTRNLGFTLEASYFMTDYEDLIAVDPFFAPANVARAEINGFEASLSADLEDKAGAVANYTFLDTKKWPAPDAEGSRLQRRPRNLLNLAIWAGPFAGLSARLDLNTTSSVEDSFNFIGADGVARFGDRPGFTKVDLAASYALSRNYKFHLKIENVFAEDYEEVKGYPAPGRTYLAGVTLSM